MVSLYEHWKHGTYAQDTWLQSEGTVGPRFLTPESSLPEPLPQGRASSCNKRCLMPSLLCSFNSNFFRTHWLAILHTRQPLCALAHVILIIHEAGIIIPISQLNQEWHLSPQATQQWLMELRFEPSAPDFCANAILWVPHWKELLKTAKNYIQHPRLGAFIMANVS